MVRFSEMVLPGHPDKLCDQIADAILVEAYRADPQAYCQVEVGCWGDEFYLTGGITTRSPVLTPFHEIVRRVGRAVGYAGGNAIDADRFRTTDTVCRNVKDPREWTEHVNDQCIVVGYAGYDAKTRYLPPEHFLAHTLREALAASCRSGLLKGQGPDGKLLVRMREEGERWILEHVLVTIQQLESWTFSDVCAGVVKELRAAYGGLQAIDRRWVRSFDDAEVLVNPNGPLINGGPDGDNGQTGRKLVMDYYGPRVPIGGGALCGKDLSHIDRAGSYAARQAAVAAVAGGARECLIRVAYAPNRRLPLDVAIEMEGIGPRPDPSWFDHQKIVRRYPGRDLPASAAVGAHFFDHQAAWNLAATTILEQGPSRRTQ